MTGRAIEIRRRIITKTALGETFVHSNMFAASIDEIAEILRAYGKGDSTPQTIVAEYTIVLPGKE